MTYTWQDRNSNKTVTVTREVVDIDIEPIHLECADILDMDEYDNSDFVRLITGGSMSKGFGRKGFW